METIKESWFGRVKIALMGVVLVSSVAAIPVDSYAQETPLVQSISAKLAEGGPVTDILSELNSFDDSSLSLQHAGSLKTRRSSSSSASNIAYLRVSAASRVLASDTAVAVQSYDPWGRLNEDSGLTYREVKYLYDTDGVTPYAIVEVVGKDETRLICKIAIIKDGESVRTTLHYQVDAGYGVTVEFSGAPQWTNLLASASIKEGVFYGVSSGGIITKASVSYNANGKKSYGIMKVYTFDENGKECKVEVTKERYSYNRNGDLVSQSTVVETDGQLSMVYWVSHMYDSKGVLLATAANELRYGANGAIASSKSEQWIFNKDEKETSYILTEYDAGHKTHSIKRTTDYALTQVSRCLQEEIWYKKDGSAATVSRTEKSDNYYNIDGHGIRVEEEVTSFVSEAFKSETRFKRTTDLATGTVRTFYSQRNDENYFERVEECIYDETAGAYRTTYSATNSDALGVYFHEETESGEYYSEEGRLAEKRTFRKRQSRVGGELVTTYEESWATKYTYDADGDIIREHEKGYWFSTVIDPFSNNLKQYIYGVIDGIKKLVGVRISNVTAEDKEFSRITYTYDEDTSYRYLTVNGQVLLAGTKSVQETKSYLPSGQLTWSTERVQNETYSYDDAGRIIAKETNWTQTNKSFYGKDSWTDRTEGTTIESHEYDKDGRLIAESTYSVTKVYYGNSEGYENSYDYSSLATAAYTYYDNGTCATVTRHSESSYSGWLGYGEDEFIMYNEQGRLLVQTRQTSDGGSYYEERTYADDGVTMLTRDVVSHNSWGMNIIFNNGGLVASIEGVYRMPVISDPLPWNLGDYELHEKYREDGKILHREERSEQYGWWYGSPNSMTRVEDWTYASNGGLLHYESTSTSHNEWNRWRLYGGDIVADPAESVEKCVIYPWGGSSDYTLTISRDYDSETGALKKEEYTVKNERNGDFGGIVILIDESRKDLPKIPGDASTLISNISNFFFAFDPYAGDGYIEQKMTIEYGSDSTITVKCAITDKDGKTISAFFGTITHDNGKITAFEVSYTGEGKERWQAMIEGVEGGLIGKIIVMDRLTTAQSDPAPEKPVLIESELDQRNALEAEQARQRQGLTGEMVSSHNENYEQYMQQ